MTDVIDEVLGLQAGDDLYALRNTRPAVKEGLQGVYDAIYDPASSTLNQLSLDERAAVALRVCLVADVKPLAEHYRARITDEAVREAAISGRSDDARLSRILEHATLVAASPDQSGRAQIDALREAGLDETALVTLTQTIAYTSFQLRVVAGLYMIGY
ncbi:CMD domain-containing protein [Kineosporia babensis]|uniref:CMD domain protein n=1 Tax=Kineosporia babensis TaxID=499548 RepID=A0A9X1NHS2_9ACTN|nr:hypothetical protein [Kineosporia babensis]MCD5314099.1 hypothetical protein [Kineosporia babensis]